ncbi:MAG: glycosyltransferase [Azospirillaceae bacterium]
MLDRALDFLLAQTWESLPAIFWVPLFLEFPRFVLGGALVGWFVASGRLGRQARDRVVEVGITAVVPAHNDPVSVRRTVDSLREQTIGPIQIVVVNDGSTDATDAACRALLRQGRIDAYLPLTARGGKAAAVNLALSVARHPLFLVTDSDTTFDRDALAEAAAPFEDPAVGVSGGTLRVRNGDATLATRVQQLNYAYSITLGRVVKSMLSFYFVASGAFGLYRTEAVRGAGGWDFGPGEDGDIMTRLRAAGWKAAFVPTAVAMTEVPESFVKLARQRLRWNRSFVRNRYRKSRAAILDVRRRDFDVPLAISFLDGYFFNGVVPFLFAVYLAHLFVTYGEMAPVFLLAVTGFYLAVDVIQFGATLTLSNRPRADLRLIAYLPLYSVVNAYFLRFVRFYAVADELIRRGSYTDPYVPAKVRARVPRY